MVSKIVEASSLKSGSSILIENEPYTVRGIDISKTGKHGHAKCRFDAISIIDERKKCVMVPGHERFEVPNIEKRKGQVLSKHEDKVNVMDLESFENLDLTVPEALKEDIKEGGMVEYWDIEGRKLIKRVN